MSTYDEVIKNLGKTQENLKEVLKIGYRALRVKKYKTILLGVGDRGTYV